MCRVLCVLCRVLRAACAQLFPCAVSMTLWGSVAKGLDPLTIAEGVLGLLGDAKTATVKKVIDMHNMKFFANKVT